MGGWGARHPGRVINEVIELEMNNIVSNDKGMSRAIVLRCSDQAFINLLELIKGYPGCYLVFSKSSPLRLVVAEQSW